MERKRRPASRRGSTAGARAVDHEGQGRTRPRGPHCMPNTSSPAKVQTKLVVPGSHSMVSLLGSRDELLRVIEQAFDTDIHVRGNEITITGDPDETALATKLFEELVTLLERGDVLTV